MHSFFNIAIGISICNLFSWKLWNVFRQGFWFCYLSVGWTSVEQSFFMTKEFDFLWKWICCSKVNSPFPKKNTECPSFPKTTESIFDKCKSDNLIDNIFSFFQYNFFFLCTDTVFFSIALFARKGPSWRRGWREINMIRWIFVAARWISPTGRYNWLINRTWGEP